MRILIIAGYFPPYSPASASRVNKLAKYLEDNGHDVRVLGPENTDFDPVILPEVSPERIHYTKYSKVNDFPGKVKDFVKSLLPRSKADISEGNRENAVKETSVEGEIKPESAISILYRKLTNIPDDLIGWYPHAVREGKDMFQGFKPEIIFATLPPFTPMLVARKLGKISEAPVVYDYRDLWTDHPYYGRTGVRKFIDTLLENYALKRCAGLITVTKTWAEHLKKARNVPVEFVMNGFDPDDFSKDNRKNYNKDKITLLYAGYLYGEKRDPSVVFEALGTLGEKAQDFTVLLYTPEGESDLNDNQRKLITENGLQDVVCCHKYIPQKELYQIQQQVDVLMLLRWNDPSEDGVIAGKLFEYIGAGKPILSLGSVTGEAADIVRDNGFGLVSNNADEVANYLNDLLTRKQNGDDIAQHNPKSEKFTRAKQFEKLVNFLEGIIKDHNQET